MSRPYNPYVAGPPLRGQRGFFGRQDTLNWVIQELHNPATNSLVLFGQRRVGKTTLLLQLERVLTGEVFLPIYFDLQDQARRPLSRVLADLADITSERGNMESPDLAEFDDQGRFFRDTFLPRFHQAVGKERRLVFLMDEFDVLDQVTEVELPETAAAKLFFPFLRELMMRDTHLAFVFVVGRRAEDLSLNFMATFKASLVKEVWILDQTSAQALVRQGEDNSTLYFTDPAVARIVSLTSGHPYLTQLLCQRIWERAYSDMPATPPKIDIAEVDAALPDTLETGSQAFGWLWDSMSPPEKIYSVAVAEAISERESVSEDHITRVLADSAARLRTREVELAPRDLVRRQVLQVVSERQHVFAVDLFRRWVRKHKLLREVKDELDRIDPLAERSFEVGEGYFRRREWDTSIRNFQDALNRNPHHFRARLLLSEALLGLGQIDKAVTEMRQAFELDREEACLPYARMLLMQAKAREQAGDEEGALSACESTLQVSPNEREAKDTRTRIWKRKAGHHESARRWEQAQQLYEKLLVHEAADDQRRVWQAARDRCQEEEELSVLFDEGWNAYKHQDLQYACDALAKVAKHRPDYQKNGIPVSKLLTHVTTALTRPGPYLNAFSYPLEMEQVEQFYGRRHEVKFAFGLLRSRQNISVVGPSKIGKTWFLHYISHPATLRNYGIDPQHNICVYLDCKHHSMQQEQHQVYKAILDSITDAARQVGVDLAPENGKAPPLGEIYQYLHSTLRNLGPRELRLVLLLDEYEAMVQNPRLTGNFFSGLRSFASNSELTYVTASRIPLASLEAVRIGAPFFNIFQQISLGPFMPEDSRHLVEDTLNRADRRFPKGLIELVLELGRDEPFFLQMAMRHALELEVKGEELSENERATFLESAKEAIRYRAIAENER